MPAGDCGRKAESEATGRREKETLRVRDNSGRVRIRNTEILFNKAIAPRTVVERAREKASNLVFNASQRGRLCQRCKYTTSVDIKILKKAL